MRATDGGRRTPPAVVRSDSPERVPMGAPPLRILRMASSLGFGGRLKSPDRGAGCKDGESSITIFGASGFGSATGGNVPAGG